MSKNSNDSPDDFEEEMHRYFFQEAAVNLEESESNYLAMSKDPSTENLEQALRLSHNLKGSAKAVGFYDISEFLHKVEELLLLVKSKVISCSQELISVLLECNDRIKYNVENLKNNKKYKGTYNDIIAKMDSAKANSIHIPTEKALDDDITFLDEMDFDKNEDGQKEKQVHKRKKVSGVNSDEMIRISLGKVEKLQNYIGEMVILESMLKEQIKIESTSPLKNLFRQLDKITKEVQEIVMSLRMVPILPVFQKLMRTSRDISVQINKKVVVDFFGENTELDKFILDQLSDPLIHMIRNAIDHGIESPEERETKGKKIEGYISVSAMHESGFLVVKIKDDGKGMSANKIKQKAIEKDLIDKETILSEEQCFDLIFLPGFSTKEVTTEISGRGFGMDIVKTNIENLNGSIQIQSVVDEGTEFSLKIPLAIGILDAFIVQVQDERYVIPVQQVIESIGYQKSNITHIQDLGDILILRGEEIPIFHLGSGLNTPKYDSNSNEKVIIIIQNRDKKIGVVVDKILNIQSVVTKPLGDELRCEQGITGGVILGDGKPVPIIEASELIETQIFKKNNLKNINHNLHKVG